MLPGGPLASLIRRRYCGATTRGIGPNSATLVPPADDPPVGPSVKSQTLPADSATNDQGPAAACACASAVKFSIRQKTGPAGNSATFFSASGLMRSGCCAIAVDGNDHNPDAKTRIVAMRIRFMWTPPWFTCFAELIARRLTFWVRGAVRRVG